MSQERRLVTHDATAAALPKALRSAAKRAIDLAIAVPACLVLSPVFLAAAIAVKLDSRGPAFFKQQRRGRHFEPFEVIKFRSLAHGVRDPHPEYEMLEADPRITRVGRLLRATSLDELPQLINVIQGSMSLVGPRPLVEWESQLARQGYAERFLVKPGITGWSQITVRNSVDFDGRCVKDVEYVKRWSLGLDLVIMLKTPASLLRGDSIYPAK